MYAQSIDLHMWWIRLGWNLSTWQGQVGLKKTLQSNPSTYPEMKFTLNKFY